MSSRAGVAALRRIELKTFAWIVLAGALFSGVLVLVTSRAGAAIGWGLGVGLCLTAGAGLARVLARAQTQPLREIQDLFDAVSRGPSDRRLVWSKGDERDAIALGINHSAGRIEDRIERAHRETQLLEAVMESMVEAILVVDLDGRILLTNASFQEIFDAWEDVRGRAALEVIRHAGIDAVLDEASQGSKPVVQEVKLHGPSDRHLLVQGVGFPAEGARTGTLLAFHDVTELRRLDRVRRDFIANASHELRSPITAIQGFAETLLAQEGEAGSEEDRARSPLAVILRNAQRMTHLIDDLLDLARIEREDFHLDRSDVDVARLARSLLTELTPRLERAGIRASLAPSSTGPARADRRAVEQVLENLVTNAIRYSDAGSTLTIEVQEVGERIEVSISDTGIGIPGEALDRIFERFYRVDASRARAVGSTGLGLAIVRNLVQAMGGTIRVESELGAGSTFVFTLPRAASASASSA